MRLLSVLEHEELTVGELVRTLQLAQSTASRHLKVLISAGWVERRTEGTASLLRMGELEPAAASLWEPVKRAHTQTNQFREDEIRLAAALAERPGDDAFFERMVDQWDSIRSELWGDDFLTAAVGALLPADLTVADLGCGTGPGLVALAPHVRRLIGVDREAAMLDAARRRLAAFPDVELIQGGLEALPLPNNTVDAALCTLVLHHVEDPGQAFVEAARILKPGGRFVVIDMVPHDRQGWRAKMGHRHLGFSPSDLAEMARTAGLSVGSPLPLPPARQASGPPLFLASFGRPD